MKKIKKFIVIICLVCFVSVSVSPKKVYANDGVLSYPYIVQGVASIATAIGNINPVVIIVCSIVAIGLGVAFENKDEIRAFAGEVINKCKELGKNITDLFSVNSDGVASISPELVNIINSTIDGYKLEHSDFTSVGEILNINLSDFNYDLESNPSGFLENVNLFTMTLEQGHSYNFKITLNRGTGYAFSSGFTFGSESLIHFLTVLPFQSDKFTAKSYYYNINTTSIPYTYSCSYDLKNLSSEYNTYKLSESVLNTDFVYSMSVINPTATGYSDSTFENSNISVENILDTSSIGALDNYTGDFVGGNVTTDGVSISIPTDMTLTYDTVIDKTYDDLLSQDITIDNALDTDIPNIDGGTGDLENPSVELDLSPLYFDLSKKFPFCIPFDLVDLVKNFSSAKTRPIINVQLPEKYFGSNNIEVDLAFYDDYFPFSTILRYFLLIGFVFFLIKNTRKFMGV